MKSKLSEMLHLDLEPVGVYFGNTEAECDAVTEPGKRICVVPFLLAAARGKVVGITEEGCGCPGGTVGLCFGDGFSCDSTSDFVSHVGWQVRIIVQNRKNRASGARFLRFGTISRDVDVSGGQFDELLSTDRAAGATR